MEPVNVLSDFIHSSNSENRNENVYDNMYYKPKPVYYFASMNGAFPFNITNNDVSQITRINITIPNKNPAHPSRITTIGPTFISTNTSSNTPTNEPTIIIPINQHKY